MILVFGMLYVGMWLYHVPGYAPIAVPNNYRAALTGVSTIVYTPSLLLETIQATTHKGIFAN
jgi:hypothetical protein